jgi:hypothetical protein
METWQIIAIVAAVAAVLFFLMRKKTAIAPAQLQSQTINSAPGVTGSDGQIPSGPLPVIPNAGSPGMGVVKAVAGAPMQILQHVPIVGNLATSAVKAPINLALKTNAEITNVISNIPIAGKALAIPGKVVGAVASKISSFFGF